MAGTAVNNSASRVWYHTSNITNGALSGATAVGYMAEDGTDLSNPEVLTEEIFIGSASTGATMSAVCRVLGATIPAAMTAAAKANPPTEVYIFFMNISETKYTSIKCILTEPFQEPASTAGKRTAWMFGLSAKGDAVSDFLNVYEQSYS